MKKILILVICAILAAGLLAGCTAENDAVAGYTYESAGEGYVPENDYDMAVAEEAITETAATEAYSESSSSDSGIADTSGGVDVNSEPKLVYRSEFSLRTDDFDEDYAKIKEEAEKAGGFIEYEYMYNPSDSDYYSGRNASITVRIPAESYEEYTRTLDGIAYTESRTSDVSNISDTYYDVDSRIELLEERKERLYGHLEEATKMDDKIAIEDEISEVIYQLDDLKSQKRGMDKEVEYSTVVISLQETAAAGIDVSDPGLDPGNSFAAAFINFGSFICVQLNDLASAAPVLIVIAAVLIIVWFTVRSVSHKNGLKTDGLGMLILSILAFVFSLVFSLAGLALGVIAFIRSIKHFSESRLAKAAFFLGIAAVAVSILLIIAGTAAGSDFQYFW